MNETRIKTLEEGMDAIEIYLSPENPMHKIFVTRFYERPVRVFDDLKGGCEICLEDITGEPHWAYEHKDEEQPFQITLGNHPVVAYVPVTFFLQNYDWGPLKYDEELKKILWAFVVKLKGGELLQ